jgi:hypothetical protein
MARTATELRELMPRAFSTIAHVYPDDYRDAADRAGLDGPERVVFYRLAAERHEAAVARQEADRVRYYGEGRPRTWRAQALLRQANVGTATELRAWATRLLVALHHEERKAERQAAEQEAELRHAEATDEARAEGWPRRWSTR